ncbi:uncharacterized protein PHACADRAFT_194809 [Phanerochaete carnosa HHB-10118-sp]|uniref:Uncharacterized protein n=1 Tax=Phanerochaete carnosa (strain HHB-10118-sp) TaxID=650164 RepID=K5X359_PHACS|nr:uncharacterized protein PHACADRAFT_194809 [Phanerochaete carnosa HHB-10118-sp]EKM57247.1 hypothetical protein PHACADRAFT_194809 [Phanerochaete carnosa HHB-10118-sp]
MTAEDGTVITTVTKECNEARKDYKNAVQLGQTTSLVEHVTDDALPTGEMITTTVTYVLDLMEDDTTDQIRLQILIVNWGMAAGTVEAGTTIQQAPMKISAVYPEHCSIVSTFVEGTSFLLSREIILSGQHDRLSNVLQFSIPVQVIKFSSDHPHQRSILTLATCQFIMDLDDSNRKELSSDTKALITKLGIEYQLVSQYMSFVAMEKCITNKVDLTTEHIYELSKSNTGPAMRMCAK